MIQVTHAQRRWERDLDPLVEERGLLEDFRAGHPKALDRVYRHYVPEVERSLRSGFVMTRQGQGPSRILLSGPFELENAVQEVFLRAFKPAARMGYDGLRPYRDYLLGIARHVICDELRRRYRRPEIPIADVELDSESAEAPSDEVVASKQAVEVVQRFLQQECNDRDRRLYELRYRDGLSQQAAAKAAKLTRIQVRRWETKFRSRLLKYLKRVSYV